MPGKKILTASQFGKTMIPPRTGAWVRKLCQQGRVEGAYQVEGAQGMYLIPEGAKVDIEDRRKKK